MKEKIYLDFHLMGEHFTVEDYNETKMALYNEGMFVHELQNIEGAYDIARDYIYIYAFKF